MKKSDFTYFVLLVVFVLFGIKVNAKDLIHSKHSINCVSEDSPSISFLSSSQLLQIENASLGLAIQIVNSISYLPKQKLNNNDSLNDLSNFFFLSLYITISDSIEIRDFLSASKLDYLYPYFFFF